MENKNTKYYVDVVPYFPSFEDYYNTEKTFGHFSDDGAVYTVTDKNTPRPWVQMLYNDRFASAIANRGEGYTVYERFCNRITRFFNSELFMPRHPDGKRILELKNEDTGEAFNLFDSGSLVCNITPNYVEFLSTAMGIDCKIKVFVTKDDPCECWLITLKNTDGSAKNITLRAEQVWSFMDYKGSKAPCTDVVTENIDSGIFATANISGKYYPTLYGAFSITDCTDKNVDTVTEKQLTTHRHLDPVYKDFTYKVASVYTKATVSDTFEFCVVSAVSHDGSEVLELCKKYTDVTTAKAELLAVCEKREALFSNNTCNIPDKNMERFLNIWLKHQVGLTYLYNRNNENGGYRDVMQDCWGALLISPDYSKRRIIEALSFVYPDGHTMRVFDSKTGVAMPQDFVDCPLWAPATVCQYVKETGDLEFLNKTLPYFESDKVGTVEEHLWTMLDHAYNLRGENGLLLLRDGDWLDGLAGINHDGSATSAWATMQGFWAQSILAELEDAVGNTDKAKTLRERNEEYRKAVREVAWDGDWYVYGFKCDGTPIGSRKCREGKIYLNAQSWALLSGLETDPVRIAKMRRAVDTYLTTPYGPCLLYPPYVNDTDCGRISRQAPGTYANSAIYLHAATFKVYGDIAAGDPDTAYDTWSRTVPNHPDNPDCRRTSEPFCTGNVHFGPDSDAFGMNLHTWFTATPAWLLHGGFDEILGVKAGLFGLEITPHAPSDWNEYQVTRLYRGKKYNLNFKRGENKGIFVDGKKIADSVIPLDSLFDTFEIIY